MFIWGKIVGFLLGSLFSPIGAFIGFGLGHFFDMGLKKNVLIVMNHENLVQNTFFTSTFSVMGYIAKSSGRVNELEIKMAIDIMDRLRLNEEQRNFAVKMFNQGKNQYFDLDKTLEKLYGYCFNKKELLSFFVEIQIELALADGNLTPNEKSILLNICSKLGCSPSNFAELGNNEYSYNRYKPKDDNKTKLYNAYQTLGVSPETPLSEVKKSYKRLMSKHHPDKLIAQGLPEEMIEMAKQKTQQITSAYEMISKRATA